ncbi:MAG: plasmid pRiA4b ORF-3 family protein [Proteobacteria bacterium]|nr:plasmid pRiA4b ORF-3 family protein [Pseudomonadota bacterium]
MTNRVVYQFKIILEDINPTIWRRIQVPRSYTFWDLHVAIQDSMGWLDYHLHAFRFGKRKSNISWEIGIPDDEGIGTVDTLPGWEVSIVDHFHEPGSSCIYEYDFGDGWTHEVLLEGILLSEKGRRYPLCIGGERACPPEDCGGSPGYYRLLQVLSDHNDEEYEDMVEWVGKKFSPEKFVPNKVKFDNPGKRWDMAFSN